MRFVPRQIRLFGPDGLPLAPGTLITARPSGEQTIVGFDGVVDYNAGGNDRRLVAGASEAPVCVAEIEPARLTTAAEADALPRFDCRAGLPGVLANHDPAPLGKRGRTGATIAASNRH